MKVKYPNPSIKIEKPNKSKSHGMLFENGLNISNEYYRIHNRAIIYKKPTPIQVVKVEYPAPDPFRGTIGRMQSRALELNRSLYGFAILDPRGDPVGAWYSLPGIHVSVRMLDGNRVSISTPPLNVWDDGP